MTKRSDTAEGEVEEPARTPNSDEARAADPTETSESTTGEPTPAEAVPAEPVAPFEATIIDPPAESEPTTGKEQETLPEVPEGHELVRYTGSADLFAHGAYQFRGGQPVAVPSEIAEELLTYPHEPFERVERA